MAEYEFNVNCLEKKFSVIREFLLDDSKIIKIKYYNINDTKSNFVEKNKDFLDAIKGQPVVYCIWKKEGKKKFEPVYIGHAKDTVARMKAHLSHKAEKTGACLKNVKDAVANGEAIGITFVKITPPCMRRAVENWLIEQESGNLPWNKKN